MTPHDQNTIRDHHFETRPAAITLSMESGDAGEPFARFCDELKELTPHVAIKRDEDTGFGRPAMVLGPHKNIAYQAIPTGKLLPLFLDALTHPGTTDRLTDRTLRKKWEGIKLPATLKLYVADQCPHCPQTLDQIQNIAAVTPLFRLTVINAEMFPEQARNDQIKSVPALVLDDQFKWIGQVDVEELVDFCTNRDPSQLSSDSLRQIVENGEAQRLAEMMTESGQIFPALADLVIHLRWSVRLGAMVVVEYLFETAPELALSLCAMLWSRFSGLTPQVQVDVCHLFGMVDSEATRSYLRNITNGEFEEAVKTAAAEVLEEMPPGP